MSPEKIRVAKQVLANEQRSYLHRRGWDYRCDNPASTWLWQKPLPDGRIFVVDQDTAISLQERADAVSKDFWPKYPKEPR